MWIVTEDMNERRFWRRKSGSGSSSSKSRTGGMSRARNMSDARRILAKLRNDPDLFDAYFTGGTPSKTAVYYFPERNLLVRAALPDRSKSRKGYLIGQGAFSNKLGIVANGINGATWSLTKSTEHFYPYQGVLGTGSGADPVFEVV